MSAVLKDVTTSARHALQDHKAAITRAAEQHTAVGISEAQERETIAKYKQALVDVESLEKRRVALLADRRLFGRSKADPDALLADLTAARAHAEQLRESAQVAELVLERLGQQRATAHQNQQNLLSGLDALASKARMEVLGESLPALLEAERAYVAALVVAFGAAEAVNVLAKRNPGAHLPVAGSLNIAALYLPRPSHPYLEHIAEVQREDVDANIFRAAEQVVKAF